MHGHKQIDSALTSERTMRDNVRENIIVDPA